MMMRKVPRLQIIIGYGVTFTLPDFLIIRKVLQVNVRIPQNLCKSDHFADNK